MQVIDELRRMSDQRFHSVYEALATQGFGPLDNEVAKALKFRPQAIRKLPFDQRAKRAKTLLLRSNNAELAYELFGSYLMKDHKGLITDFLDATGIEHEDGMISDLQEGTPDLEKLDGAIEKLDGDHDAEDVTLYLSMAATQWPQLDAVDAAWRKRAEG